ncbi:unnamed protein product [Linum trigynum]|uniref:Uncharacterized protein n=1 Tax=Linum trigynum TaxID=586398 RepID=A0AAV2CV88_9ROSI
MHDIIRFLEGRLDFLVRATFFINRRLTRGVDSSCWVAQRMGRPPACFLELTVFTTSPFARPSSRSCRGRTPGFGAAAGRSLPQSISSSYESSSRMRRRRRVCSSTSAIGSAGTRALGLCLGRRPVGA